MSLTTSLKIGNATFYFPTKTSELTNDSSFVNQLKTINNQSLIGTGNLDIATAQTQVDWNETDTTSVKYINNKPTIPSKTSDLTNDSSFITNTVSNLTNYYTKTTVDSMISGIVTMSVVVVETLPTEGKEKTIYLVKKETAGTNDIYNEYLWVNKAWELIGTTQIDLSNYYTKEDTDKLLEAKADDADLKTVAKTGSYNDLTDKPTIPTVGDATITLVANGNNYDFTTNQSSDKTITLPTIPSSTTTIVVTNAEGSETKFEVYIK